MDEDRLYSVNGHGTGCTWKGGWMLWIRKCLPKSLLASFSLVLMFGGADATAQDAACSGKTAPCTVAGGSYNAAFPETWTGGPAVLHLHGFGGAGSKVIGNTGLVRNVTSRGFALIAPSGQLYDETRPNSYDWGVDDGGPHERDDVRFLKAVLDDAAARFDVDRDRILITGFSRGGSMVWDLACKAPETAQAYAPVAGGFWAPFPTDCAGPVKLLHTHGFADKTVPLEGRSMAWDGATYTQSDIYQGLQLWRRTNGCGSRASDHVVDGEFWRKIWRDCTDGAALELALHPGGHGWPKGWPDMVLDWFEKTEATQ